MGTARALHVHGDDPARLEPRRCQRRRAGVCGSVRHRLDRLDDRDGQFETPRWKYVRV